LTRDVDCANVGLAGTSARFCGEEFANLHIPHYHPVSRVAAVA